MSIDTLCYTPEEIEDIDELDEHGFTIVESLEDLTDEEED